MKEKEIGIYGVGVESLYIALDAIITVWWDGKLLSLAFGLENAAGRLGEIFGYGILLQLFIILYPHISLNSSFFFKDLYSLQSLVMLNRLGFAS